MRKINWKRTAVQLLLLAVGIITAHFGVTIFIQTGLGIDPYNVFNQGLLRSVPWPESFGWTHGRTHILVSVIIVAVTLAWTRWKYVRIGTLLGMLFGGVVIDFFTMLIRDIVHPGLPLWVRLLLLLAGCVIVAFGMAIQIQSGAGVCPYELIAVSVSDRFHKPFGPVRVVCDLAFLAVGFALGGTVGVGTVVCAFLTGPVTQLFLPRMKKFTDRVMGSACPEYT